MLTPQTPRYSQCAKPASFAAVIYHVYANFHMLSGMSGICILFVFHTHINWHLHWLFIDITDIQCWWVVLYMSKTVYCIFWDLWGILKTDKYCNWSSDYFGRTTVVINYNIPDSNQLYTLVMLCDMSWKYWILFIFFQAEPGMFWVSLSRQYKIRCVLFSRLLPWLHDAVFVKSTRSIRNQDSSLAIKEYQQCMEHTRGWDSTGVIMWCYRLIDGDGHACCIYRNSNTYSLKFHVIF